MSVSRAIWEIPLASFAKKKIAAAETSMRVSIASSARSVLALLSSENPAEAINRAFYGREEYKK